MPEFCDKDGWPVERVKGRPILNFLRLLIHTRKIRRRFDAQKAYDEATPVPLSNERINEIANTALRAAIREEAPSGSGRKA